MGRARSSSSSYFKAVSNVSTSLSSTFTSKPRRPQLRLERAFPVSLCTLHDVLCLIMAVAFKSVVKVCLGNISSAQTLEAVDYLAKVHHAELRTFPLSDRLSGLWLEGKAPLRLPPSCHALEQDPCCHRHYAQEARRRRQEGVGRCNRSAERRRSHW